MPDWKVMKWAVLTSLFDQRAERPQHVPLEFVGRDVDARVVLRVALRELSGRRRAHADPDPRVALCLQQPGDVRPQRIPVHAVSSVERFNEDPAAKAL